MFYCIPPLAKLPSTHYLCRRRRRAPKMCPHLSTEETPSQEALTSRDKHQPRKARFSPTRNIGRRSPPAQRWIRGQDQPALQLAAGSSPVFHISATNHHRRTPRAAHPRHHVMPDRSRSNSFIKASFDLTLEMLIDVIPEAHFSGSL